MATRYLHAIDRFPQQAQLIARLADESEEFRSLCEDHALVIETIARLEEEKQDRAKSVIRDYRDFLLELELDIADALATALR
jgi:hypothetical protein